MSERIAALMALAVLIFTFATTARSQIVQGLNETTNLRLGGNNFIAGTVYLPNGQRADRKMAIRLTTPQQGDFVVETDTSGQFIFAGLPAGSYTVAVDKEEEFFPATQTIEIISDRERIRQAYSVTIKLKARGTAREPVKPSVIMASPISSTNYVKAKDLANKGDHRGAIGLLKLVTGEYPDFFDAFNELAVQYMRVGELAPAEAALLTALKIKPDAFESTLNLGIVLFRTNRLTEAETSLREIVRLNDTSAIGHFYLGRTLAKLKNFDEAEKELNLAIARGGDEMREAHRMLGMMYIDKDDRPRAAASLEKYLLLVPAAPDAEQLRQAIAQLRAAIPKQ